jgi:hypothetical protein
MNTANHPKHPCKKFSSCNAPICPLDPNYKTCRTQKGEPVCLWLREGMKVDGCIPPKIESQVREALHFFIEEEGANAVLREKLERAAVSGSKRTQLAVSLVQCEPALDSAT